jgi:hypothetical protein
MTRDEHEGRIAVNAKRGTIFAKFGWAEKKPSDNVSDG